MRALRFLALALCGVSTAALLLCLFTEGHDALCLPLALLIDDTITCAMAAPLYGAVLRYLKAELADGTPFTDSGAAALRRLGVLTIVLPIISLALRTIPYSAFAVALPSDRSNVETVIPGIMLILMSVVCRYGAELAAARPEAAIMAGTEAEKEMI